MDNNFEEARQATKEMFENDNQSEQSGAEQSAENASAAEGVPPEVTETSAPQPAAENNQATLDQAVQTAEIAAQAASERDGQLNQAMQEIEALKQQNSQLQGTIDELSRQNEQRIVEEVLEPPVLDVNALAFADEETIRAAQAKYAADMSAYNRSQLMKELAPALEYAKQGMREKEKTEVVSALSQIPELSGISEMLPQLDRIIENNKWLSSDDMPVDEKYINAYAIARGVNSINTPPQEAKEPTADELMAMYNNNPAFQELIEKQRLEQIKQSQQVPQFSASSGAVNAALNIKEKPQTIEEASERTRKLFGLI